MRAGTNWYSTPLTPGKRVTLKLLPLTVEAWHDGRVVARHERCYERGRSLYELEHYLDVLERKPGALAGSTPLAQWRERGRWPASYDALWAKLNDRHGKLDGTRQMVDVVRLGQEHGHGELRRAVGLALELGCADIEAVRHLLDTTALHREPARALDDDELGPLARYERPAPEVSHYNELLKEVNR